MRNAIKDLPPNSLAIHPDPYHRTVTPTDTGKRQVELPIYAELKRLIKQQGLLKKQPVYYAFKIPLTLGLLAISLYILVTVDSLAFQLVNAAFLGFVFTQIGFIGHDAGHRQIFHSMRNNEIVGLIITFLLASDRSWWIDKHNRHHNNPNHVDLDPDIDIPVIAFTPEQARAKRGLYKFIIKHQAYFYFPILSLEGIGLRLAGLQYMAKMKVKYPVLETLLMASHFLVYFGMLFYLLQPWHAVLFIVVHQMFFGLYVGSVFAPNHKGMPMIDDDSQLDFVRRQVLTSRNIKSHPLTDFWYGGLNYQNEHHLFPSMPRNNLKKSQSIVKAFCKSHAIDYHETSMFQSQKEILRYLHEISDTLDEAKTTY